MKRKTREQSREETLKAMDTLILSFESALLIEKPVEVGCTIYLFISAGAPEW